VPTAKYTISPAAQNPVVPHAAAFIANGGAPAADLMCRLSTSQADFPAAKLKALYKTKQGYTAAVARRLTELEKAGWSLPVYREMILADAAKIAF
jgi:hypothetical protein